jgi:pyrroline-5-carboxylate reductase
MPATVIMTMLRAQMVSKNRSPMRVVPNASVHASESVNSIIKAKAPRTACGQTDLLSLFNVQTNSAVVPEIMPGLRELSGP